MKTNRLLLSTALILALGASNGYSSLLEQEEAGRKLIGLLGVSSASASAEPASTVTPVAARTAVRAEADASVSRVSGTHGTAATLRGESQQDGALARTRRRQLLDVSLRTNHSALEETFRAEQRQLRALLEAKDAKILSMGEHARSETAKLQSAYDQVQQELQQTQRTLDQKAQELLAHDAEHRQIIQRLRDQEVVVQRKQQSITAAEEEKARILREVQRRTEAQELVVREAQERLAAATQTSAENERALEEAHRQVQASTEEKDRVLAQIAAVESACAKIERQTNEATQRVVALEDSLRQKGESLQKAEEARDGLQAQIQDLSERAEAGERVAAALETLKQQYAQSLTSIKHQQETIETLEQEKGTLEGTLKRTQEENARAREKLKEEFAQVQTHVQKLTQELQIKQTLLTEALEKEELRNRAEYDVQAYVGEVADTANVLQKEVNQLRGALGQKERLKKKISELTTRLSAAEQEKKRAAEEWELGQREIMAQTRLAQQAREEMQNLKVEFMEVNGELDNLRKERRTADSGVKVSVETDSPMELLRVKNYTISQELETTQAEMTQLLRQMEKLEEENSRLQGTLKLLQEQPEGFLGSPNASILLSQSLMTGSPHQAKNGRKKGRETSSPGRFGLTLELAELREKNGLLEGRLREQDKQYKSFLAQQRATIEKLRQQVERLQVSNEETQREKIKIEHEQASKIKKMEELQSEYDEAVQISEENAALRLTILELQRQIQQNQVSSGNSRTPGASPEKTHLGDASLVVEEGSQIVALRAQLAAQALELAKANSLNDIKESELTRLRTQLSLHIPASRGLITDSPPMQALFKRAAQQRETTRAFLETSMREVDNICNRSGANSANATFAVPRRMDETFSSLPFHENHSMMPAASSTPVRGGANVLAPEESMFGAVGRTPPPSHLPSSDSDSPHSREESDSEDLVSQRQTAHTEPPFIAVLNPDGHPIPSTTELDRTQVVTAPPTILG